MKELHNPEMTGWWLSMSGYMDRGWMVNIPLYFVEEWVVWEGE